VFGFVGFGLFVAGVDGELVGGVVGAGFGFFAGASLHVVVVEADEFEAVVLVAEGEGGEAGVPSAHAAEVVEADG